MDYASLPAQDVFDSWWKGKPGCHSSRSTIMVDDTFLRQTLEAYAVSFARKHSVPVHCNQVRMPRVQSPARPPSHSSPLHACRLLRTSPQWGVKGEVFDENGRLRYAQAMLSIFTDHSISSTYWIWRSMQKGGRDVQAPV